MENLQGQEVKQKPAQKSAQRPNDVVEIDLKEMFFMLLASWKLILVAMLAGMAIMGAYHTFMITPTYQAEADMYITSNDSVISFSDLQLSAELTEDYALIVKSRTVLNRVIDQLDLDLNYRELGNLISVSNPDSTHIIEITVTCDDLELSRDIANALLNVSIDQIYQIVGSGEPTVIDYAEAEAVEDVTPSITRYMLMGGLLGAALVCVVLVVRMLMNTTMKTEEDIEKYLQIPLLAAVPYYNVKNSHR